MKDIIKELSEPFERTCICCYLGKQLQDECPKERGCSTHPLWSDDRVTKAILYEAPINAYIPNGDECRFKTIPLHVIRCSWDTSYDIIYRYVGPHQTACATAFCGMD